MGKQKKKKKTKSRDQLVETRERKKEERKIRKCRKEKENRRKYTSDFEKLAEQIRPLGLCLRKVSADGNCFFRSVADQLEGKPSNHPRFRAKACSYMAQHRESFEPFIVIGEDGSSFDDYLRNMSKDKEWAGQMELKAIAQSCNVHVVVHQLGSARWIVRSSNPSNRYIHLGYTGGAHYDSIRRLEYVADNPKPLDVDGKLLSEKVIKAGTTEAKAPTKTEAYLMRASRCDNLQHVRRVLMLHNDNFDGALKQLVRDVQTSYETMSATSVAETPATGDDDSFVAASATETIETASCVRTKPKRKVRVSRNKPCPCGSGQKYKHCCKEGSRSSKTLSNKERKIMQRAAKASERKSTSKTKSSKNRSDSTASKVTSAVDHVCSDLGSLNV